MKKVVFLLCFIVLMVPNKVNAESAFQCGDSSIVFETKMVDSNKELLITKNGSSPFQTTFSKENVVHYVNDVVCFEESFIIYGYLHNKTLDTYYDSFILELDASGNEIHYVDTDYGDLEEVKSMFYVDQTYFVLVRRSTDEDREITYSDDFVVLYDTNFEVVSIIELEDEVKKYEINNNVLMINYGYDNQFELGINTSGEQLISGAPLEVDNVYVGSVDLLFLNEAYVNGERMTNGYDTEYPGYYTLNYQEQVYEFIVHPVVSGVEDNHTYTDSLSITFSGGNGMLNNEIYLSGTEISGPGNYVLEVLGANDYSTVYRFTISADVSGVINGHSYEDNIIVEFEGIGYLNNNVVVTPLEVNTPGDYVLKIKGENGYLDTYQFSVIEKEPNKNISSVVQNLDIFLVVIVVVAGVIILKKK